MIDLRNGQMTIAEGFFQHRLWVVNTYIPMARSIRAILNAVVVIVVVVWLLNVFGLLDSVRSFRIGAWLAPISTG